MSQILDAIQRQKLVPTYQFPRLQVLVTNQKPPAPLSQSFTPDALDGERDESNYFVSPIKTRTAALRETMVPPPTFSLMIAEEEENGRKATPSVPD